MMTIWARLILRRAGLVASIGTLLALVGCYYSVLLYKNLRTDIEELLPTSSRSVQDLYKVTDRLESIDNIVTLIFSKDTKASKRFFFDLAKKLELAPKSIISAVEYRLESEIKFFKDHRALYIDLADLERIRDYISDRITYEHELYNPLNIFRTGRNELIEPSLDFKALQKKYSRKTSDYEHLPGGLYATEDEQVRAIIAYRPGKGLDGAIRLKETVDKAVVELNPKSYALDLEVKFTGNAANQVEESAALVEDLMLSTVIVMVIVTLAMIIFFRSFMATMTLILSLLMGTFWAFGIAFFVVGYLNANTAFLASIVLGNGINFGIIFLARFLEERRKGVEVVSNDQAIVSAMVNTAVPTLTAALAAGLSYGSLMLTEFRGFSQFGVIGFLGMMCCWVSAYSLLPSYLVLYDRFKNRAGNAVKVNTTVGPAVTLRTCPKISWASCGVFWPTTSSAGGKKCSLGNEHSSAFSPPASSSRLKIRSQSVQLIFGQVLSSPVAGSLAWLVAKFPVFVCLLSVAGIVLSIISFINVRNEGRRTGGNYGIIEMDFTKLRDKRSMTTGSGALYHYIDDIFGHTLSPMVILPHVSSNTQKIADILREEQKKEGKDPVIAAVQSLEDFVPKEQERKVAIINEIRNLLPARMLARLSPQERALTADFFNPRSLDTFNQKELPPLVLKKFTEKDGSLGKIVLVSKKIEKTGDDANALIEFVKKSRELTDSIAPGTPVAGDLPISYDMFQSILRDGPKTTLIALIAVVLLVIILFHNVKTVSLILVGLALGIVWYAGIILGFHLKINFLNFIALPITFGIGVDYGVNIFKRYQEEGRGSILKVIRNTGGAVLLSSFTTIIGYSSLLIAGNQAFVSFGRLAVVGEFACVTAAVVALPALLQILE